MWSAASPSPGKVKPSLSMHAWCRQAIEARRLTARGVAAQWFGCLLRPAAPADAWLLEGLAGWLEDHYVRAFLGANELAYRCGPASALLVLLEPLKAIPHSKAVHCAC